MYHRNDSSTALIALDTSRFCPYNHLLMLVGTDWMKRRKAATSSTARKWELSRAIRSVPHHPLSLPKEAVAIFQRWDKGLKEIDTQVIPGMPLLPRYPYTRKQIKAPTQSCTYYPYLLISCATRLCYHMLQTSSAVKISSISHLHNLLYSYNVCETGHHKWIGTATQFITHLLLKEKKVIFSISIDHFCKF